MTSSTQPPLQRSRWSALGIALTLEGLGLGAGLAWVAAHPPAPPPLTALPIAIEAPPVAAPPPEPLPPPPKEAPPPPKPAPMAPAHVAPPKPAPAPTPAPVAPTPSEQPVAATPAPATQTVSAPPVAPPPALPPPKGPIGPSSEYIAKVRAAVQAAFVYPPAAKALEFSGRTRVAFHLMDGHPGGAHVLVGSGMGLVDKAALQAVTSAEYPAPPAELRGVDSGYEIWIEFRP